MGSAPQTLTDSSDISHDARVRNVKSLAQRMHVLMGQIIDRKKTPNEKKMFTLCIFDY